MSWRLSRSSQQVAKHFVQKAGVALSLLVQIVRVYHVCNPGMYATTKGCTKSFLSQSGTSGNRISSQTEYRFTWIYSLTQMQQQLWTDNAPPPAVIDVVI